MARRWRSGSDGGKSRRLGCRGRAAIRRRGGRAATGGDQVATSGLGGGATARGGGATARGGVSGNQMAGVEGLRRRYVCW